MFTGGQIEQMGRWNRWTQVDRVEQMDRWNRWTDGTDGQMDWVDRHEQKAGHEWVDRLEWVDR